MRVTILNDLGVVVNVIAVDENWQAPEDLKIGPEGGAIGDLWNGVSYEKPSLTVVPIAPSADDVRLEASLRMQKAFNARDATHLSYIIDNAIREVARLNQVKIGVPNSDGSWLVAPREWTLEERTRLVELYHADLLLEKIREASNMLEPNPPADYTSDVYWPKSP